MLDQEFFRIVFFAKFVKKLIFNEKLIKVKNTLYICSANLMK